MTCENYLILNITIDSIINIKLFTILIILFRFIRFSFINGILGFIIGT